MSSHLAALALLIAPVALAQSPQPGTVTADATEVVRMKPDQARIVLSARTRSPDASTASDEASEQTKKFTEAVEKLKLKGVKVTTAPLQTTKGAEDNNGGVRVIGPGGPGGVVPPKEVQATREVTVIVSDADFAALAEAVEKVQREAHAAGLSGAKVSNAYNPYGSEGEKIKVTYHRKDGSDEATAAALSKATKKATTRAEAIASGLGMKLGAVVSAGEVDPVADAASSSRVIYYGGDSSDSTKDDLVDGELVRTVRVRVVFNVTK